MTNPRGARERSRHTSSASVVGFSTTSRSASDTDRSTPGYGARAGRAQRPVADPAGKAAIPAPGGGCEAAPPHRTGRAGQRRWNRQRRRHRQQLRRGSRPDAGKLAGTGAGPATARAATATAVAAPATAAATAGGSGPAPGTAAAEPATAASGSRINGGQHRPRPGRATATRDARNPATRREHRRLRTCTGNGSGGPGHGPHRGPRIGGW